MIKPVFFFAMMAFLAGAANAQSATTWNGKTCAVVLTYDDALNVDLTNVLPALDSVGLKATFYLSDYFGGLQAQIERWRAAAKRGHELGNHTVFHPCEGGRPGREFVGSDYDLTHYSFRRINDEIRTMNTLLFSIDGKTVRTFAFPCSDTKIHDTAYIDSWRNAFVAARAVRSEMPTIEKVDLFNLPGYPVNGESGDQLVSLVKEAAQKQALLIFLFHGVGGEHSLNVSLLAHRQLLQFLAQNQKTIWVAPLLNVAQFIKQKQVGRR